jgi:SAM-dependent methyltransferase
MLAGLPDDHPSIRYYDGDYPGVETTSIVENLDRTIAAQGLAEDIARFREIAGQFRGRVLEIGCGTGRVLVPLARDGIEMTGIDISAGMIERLKARLAEEKEETRDRINVHVDDARSYGGESGAFAVIIIPFNGFSCILSQRDQQAALENAARLLMPGGRLVVDVVNPFVLPLNGSGAPRPFFQRINPETGRTYTRFAAMGPIQGDQTQRLFGWYDELDEGGLVHRTAYELTWRLTFAPELSLMMESVGLDVESVEGDHRRSAYGATSPKIFLIASKPR